MKVSNSTLVRKILKVLEHIGRWRLRHVPREYNKDVDFPVKMVSDRNESVQVFDEAPGGAHSFESLI